MGGRDKALIVLHGRPLIQHVLDRMAPQLTRIAVSANGDAARFSVYGLPVLADQHHDKGPLAGVAAGLIWARDIGAKALVTSSVDCPFLPLDLVARLSDASGPALNHPVLTRAGGRDHATMALWPVRLLPDLLAHLAADAPPRLAQFLIQSGALTTDFGDSAAFDNLNTPDDLAAAETRAS